MDKKMIFTEEELLILSEGLLVLINNAGEAKRLVANNDIDLQAGINKRIQRIVKLNTKICGEMEKYKIQLNNGFMELEGGKIKHG